MARYMGLVKQRLGSFAAWKLEHIPRDSNERVDALAVVAVSILIKETVFLPIYYQLASFIATDQISQIDETSPSSWLTHILYYLSSGELPNNRIEAHKVRVQATLFSLVNRQLYKRSLDKPYLKCLTAQQGQYILAELHEGVCGNHQSSRTLAHKVYTQGYYWPTMRVNATTHVKKNNRYQWQAPISRMPSQDLATITSP